ncbi:MAG TPA: coenzyme F430 synthase [Methanothrix sp.]|nr:coenzyme F430 synthase [Methanothrix sp.]
MHCGTGMQAGRRSSQVAAVLDTVHGASTIARKMVSLGWQAEAFEVYHHNPDLSDFDLIVAPVHLPPSNPALREAKRQKKKIITHHQAVGDLLKQEIGQDIRVYEVTGTHSKTTTALLLALMLSRREKVLTHTTRGLEVWHDGSARLIETGMSITPGNVIRAVEAAESEGVFDLICEVSLGGTGLADYAILTSLSGDYMIAGGSKWASTAKLQMLSLAKRGFKFLANSDIRLSQDVSFAGGGMVYARPDRLVLFGEEVHLDLGADLDFWGYETAIAAAAATASISGEGSAEIAVALSGFDGFSGRMKIRRNEGQTIFDCSNSGLKVKDVARALDRSSGLGLVAVIGEDAATVCEGLDISALASLLRERRAEIARLILVGERLMPLADELLATTARNLQDGLEIAQRENPKRLLSCVKCFR